jgi:hypothetical protein
MLVHLTSQRNVSRIRRHGIAPQGRVVGLRGVYALPVLQDYYASHQWLRELRQFGPRLIVAVCFRIPDPEPVMVGHYGKPHVLLPARQAVSVIMEADSPLGYQVIVPRRIQRAELTAVRRVPQVVGWRYYPGAHGHRPCPCPVCTAGQYGGRKIRARQASRRLRPPGTTVADTRTPQDE